MAKAKTTKLSEILTWPDYWKQHEQDLLKFQSVYDGGTFAINSKINSKVSLYQGNITLLEVDGIVSANNAALISTGGVSATISAAAGKKLTAELKTVKGCAPGEAKVTKGHDLPAKFVIHTVGPTNADVKVLENCYNSCLRQMELIKLKSLAFCCIATGNYGFPSDRAASIALKTVRQWLENMEKNQTIDTLDRIIFCLYTSNDIEAYQSKMQVFFPCPWTTHDDYQTWLLMSVNVRRQQLRPLTGFIEVTTEEPDMLTLDDDPATRRAKMPCGHVIGSESMADYLKDQTSKGRFEFACPDPNCDVKWPWFLVRHVACLSDEETKEIEIALSKNYLKKSKGMQTCPKCNVWCIREDTKNNCVECPICTAKQGKRCYFCWVCLADWKTPGYQGKTCGNPQCTGIDQRIAILASCPEKAILNRNAPAIRGCPKCGLLIEYIDRCSQMHCAGCGHFFCFFCLQGAETKAALKCNPYKSTCDIAPRQTNLPGM